MKSRDALMKSQAAQDVKKLKEISSRIDMHIKGKSIIKSLKSLDSVPATFTLACLSDIGYKADPFIEDMYIPALKMSASYKKIANMLDTAGYTYEVIYDSLARGEITYLTLLIK